jgi:hypothetical protein
VPDWTKIDKFVDTDSNDPESTPSNRAREFARENGLVVTEGHDRLLLLDIDDQYSLTYFLMIWKYYAKELEWTDCLWTVSRSGGVHVKIYLREDVDIVERLLLQACLGSDRVRERLGLIRYKANDKMPTLLIDHPEAQWSNVVTLNGYQITKGQPPVEEKKPEKKPISKTKVTRGRRK